MCVRERMNVVPNKDGTTLQSFEVLAISAVFNVSSLSFCYEKLPIVDKCFFYLVCFRGCMKKI